MPTRTTAPTYFATGAEFGRWLASHGHDTSELLVGFHKRATGTPCMTWPESVDEALVHGWIDGVRKRIDAHAYTIRFTPRRPASTWSAINIAKVAALQAAGRMQPAGLAAFARRSEAKSRTYAYEQADVARLDAREERLFRTDRAAWAYFAAQAASYRQRVTWQIVSAKRAETRAARLQRLIAASGRGEQL